MTNRSLFLYSQFPFRDEINRPANRNVPCVCRYIYRIPQGYRMFGKHQAVLAHTLIPHTIPYGGYDTLRRLSEYTYPTLGHKDHVPPAPHTLISYHYHLPPGNRIPSYSFHIINHTTICIQHIPRSWWSDKLCGGRFRVRGLVSVRRFGRVQGPT